MPNLHTYIHTNKHLNGGCVTTTISQYELLKSAHVGLHNEGAYSEVLWHADASRVRTRHSPLDMRPVPGF